MVDAWQRYYASIHAKICELFYNLIIKLRLKKGVIDLVPYETKLVVETRKRIDAKHEAYGWTIQYKNML